jgi:hypothetical protein
VSHLCNAIRTSRSSTGQPSSAGLQVVRRDPPSSSVTAEVVASGRAGMIAIRQLGSEERDHGERLTLWRGHLYLLGETLEFEV